MSVPSNFLPDPHKRLNADWEITIKTEQKETAYVLPRLDLRSCIISLQRYLLCLHPKAAEELWWQRGEHRPLNRWCVLKSEGQDPWYTFSDGVSGKSGTTPPLNVKPEDILIFEAPSNTPTTLQKYLHLLVEQFDDHLADDLRWKEKMIAWWPVYTGMYLPNYTSKRVSDFLSKMDIILKNGMMPTKVWQTTFRDLRNDYVNFQITADAAADMCFIVKVMESLLENKDDVGLDQGIPIPTNNPSFLAFMDGVVRYSTKRDFLYILLKNVCENMQAKGEQLQNEIADAKHVGEYYGWLFESSLWFISAQRGYRFMMKEWGSGQNNELRNELVFCEERNVIAGCSLGAQFADSLDQRDLLSAREDIAAKQNQFGDKVAIERAKEFIETKLQYPPFTMSFLLGETDEYPLRRL